MTRIALKALTSAYEFVVGAMIVSAVLFSGYSIWDNYQVYRAAKNVQEAVRELKPAVDEEGGPNFDDLRAINEDVIGWIDVKGTNIDYPVLQGEDNLTYMNKDVYGNFSLAGSLFLDVRNHADFSDPYSLIYGHNMDDHLMFGDLMLFKDKTFFSENLDAELLLPEELQEYKVAAILQISAGTDEIFNPDRWQDGLKGLGEFLETHSIWYHKELIELLIAKPNSVGVVSLATCSDGSTNDRTVLILVREKPEDPGEPDTPTQTDDNEIIGGGIKPTGDGQNPSFWYKIMGGILLFIIAFETIERFINRARNKVGI